MSKGPWRSKEVREAAKLRRAEDVARRLREVGSGFHPRPSCRACGGPAEDTVPIVSIEGGITAGFVCLDCKSCF